MSKESVITEHIEITPGVLGICDKLRKSANCQGGRQKNVKQDETLTWQAVEP